MPPAPRSSGTGGRGWPWLSPGVAFGGSSNMGVTDEVLSLSLLTRQYGSTKSCPAGSVVQVEPLRGSNVRAESGSEGSNRTRAGADAAGMHACMDPLRWWWHQSILHYWCTKCGWASLVKTFPTAFYFYFFCVLLRKRQHL